MDIIWVSFNKIEFIGDIWNQFLKKWNQFISRHALTKDMSLFKINYKVIVKFKTPTLIYTDHIYKQLLFL